MVSSIANVTVLGLCRLAWSAEYTGPGSVFMAVSKVGRNDSCPCGSGRKHKHCCGVKAESNSQWGTYALIGVVVAIVGVIAYTFTADGGGGGRQVWDPDHGHYHTVP